MSGRNGPATLAVRAAVRRELADLPSGARVLVACSGGPDSLALAAAAGFVAPRLGLHAGAITIDHGLQAGSARVAQAAAATCGELGLHPTLIEPVTVTGGGDGPEAAAREARYAALDRVAAGTGALAVLLGHTRDDQAESVLLGLLRGSGARSLAGMAGRRGVYRRPLLALERSTTVTACAEQHLQPWADPHNDDPAYARVTARAVLAELEARLGPGVRAGLARSAALLRADDQALADLAGAAYAELHEQGSHQLAQVGEQGISLDCQRLAALPTAVRTRVLHRAALAAGARPADLSSTQVAALDALVVDWHGQGEVDLPGRVRGFRDCGRLHLAGFSPSSSPLPARIPPDVTQSLKE